MKKLLFLVFFVTSLFSDTLKTDNFIGIYAGNLTIVDRDNTETYVGVKIGGYFYDKNSYLISNRIYLSISKVLTNNTSFYINNLNLDWIWNQIPYIKPFIGLSGGYLYYSYGTNNFSSGIYGIHSGILIYLGSNLELEIGGNIDHPTQHRDVWKDNLKKVYGGINFSF